MEPQPPNLARHVAEFLLDLGHAHAHGRFVVALGRLPHVGALAVACELESIADELEAVDGDASAAVLAVARRVADLAVVRVAGALIPTLRGQA